MFAAKSQPPQVFSHSSSECRFFAEAIVTINDETTVLCPDFSDMKKESGRFTATATHDGVELRWEIVPCGDSSIRLRLFARNRGASPIHVQSLTPLAVENGALKLGGHESGEWIFYRQGRHKNDLPSVCCLGRDDESFSDALSSLSETGGMGGGADGLTLISDNLTVIKGCENSSENMVIAFTTGADHLIECTLTLDEKRRFSALKASSICNVRLDAGKEVASEEIEVSFAHDVFKKIESFAVEKAALYNARKGRIFKDPPSVFCTWYYYGLSVSENDVRENLDELIRRKIPFDVYQIDEGWEMDRGDWRVNEKFSSGMKKVAEDIRAGGYVPGIWTSPFIAHETTPIFAEHPEWFLNHFDGTPCLFPMNRTVYRVLDITNPQAIDWVAQLYKTLREWGYMYHKLDFTRAAVIQNNCYYHDDSISIAKAYRDAVQVIRDNIGEDAYFLMCGGLYDPLIGIVDGQRAGSDTLSMWSLMNTHGGKAAPFTIKQSLLRYWMNAWWDNDPDSLMVRRQKEQTLGLDLTYGLLTEREAMTSTLNQYLGGGLVCSTEPMAKIDDDRLFLLRHIMPVITAKPTPRSMFAAARYPAMVDVENNGSRGERWHTVGFINWSDSESMPCEFTLDESLIGDFAREHSAFIVSTFDGAAVIENVAYGAKLSLGEIPPHGSLLIKIAPQNSLPSVIGSDSHYSMGSELERLDIEAGQLIFDLDYGFDYPVSYTVRLPEGFHTRRMPANVSASGRDVRIYIPARGRYDVRIPLSEEYGD